MLYLVLNRGRSGNIYRIRCRRLIKVPVPDRPTEENAVIPSPFTQMEKSGFSTSGQSLLSCCLYHALANNELEFFS